jgi:8-oxo-dGTP pyrophosphatase MutT (NUDIX family)
VPTSPYIQRLRSFVGHELLLIPAAAALVEDDAGRLLLVRQSDTGQWAAVGGAIDPGESPEQAAIREAAEETGLQVTIDRLVGVVGGGEFEVTYPNGDRVAYISTVYSAHATSGEIRVDDDEVIEASWFRIVDIVAMDLHPFTRALLVAVGYLTVP